MTTTISQIDSRGSGTPPFIPRYVSEMLKYSIAWLSAADGSFSETLTNVQGRLERVSFIPGSGGTQPSDLYDLVITDDNGIDVLAGQGANLSNATKSNICPGVPLKDGVTTSVVPMTVSGSLAVAITNAGNAKTGTIVLYVRP